MFYISLDENNYCIGFTAGNKNNLDNPIEIDFSLYPKTTGQKFDPENMQWLEEYAPWYKEPIPTPEPYQPTNAEVAQMISDLQVDLIIAGVI